MEKSKSGKVVYLQHVHTPEMQRKLEQGCSVLNEIINELELKRRGASEEKPAAAG